MKIKVVRAEKSSKPWPGIGHAEFKKILKATAEKVYARKNRCASANHSVSPNNISPTAL